MSVCESPQGWVPHKNRDVRAVWPVEWACLNLLDGELGTKAVTLTMKRISAEKSIEDQNRFGSMHIASVRSSIENRYDVAWRVGKRQIETATLNS